MRYVFIVNPKAGSHNRTNEVREQAATFFQLDECAYKVYETTGKEHATAIAKEESQKGDPLRIYGFGGDGTLLEIARGAQGQQAVEVGIFPTGSGNDYIRSYGKKEQFLNFAGQMRGTSIAVDMIDTQHGQSLNICSVGLDAKVAYKMGAFKKIPGIKGSLAYDLALVQCLTQKLGDKLRLQITTPEGVKEIQGAYTFVLAAAGTCYGAGYIGAPMAVTNDGLLDFVLIKKIPLHKIPSMVPIYKKGEHLTSPKFAAYLSVYKGTKMVLESDEQVFCSRDGECNKVARECFSIKKACLRFILPKGVTYDKTKG